MNRASGHPGLGNSTTATSANGTMSKTRHAISNSSLTISSANTEPARMVGDRANFGLPDRLHKVDRERNPDDAWADSTASPTMHSVRHPAKFRPILGPVPLLHTQLDQRGLRPIRCTFRFGYYLRFLHLVVMNRRAYLHPTSSLPQDPHGDFRDEFLNGEVPDSDLPQS
jgi:hypothetical protein